MKAEHLVIRDQAVEIDELKSHNRALSEKLSESQKENEALRKQAFFMKTDYEKVKAKLDHLEFMAKEKNLARDIKRLAEENERMIQQNKELGRMLAKLRPQLEMYKEMEAKGYIHKTPGTQV
jgi:predicted nuclease with TOPRIM domain